MKLSLPLCLTLLLGTTVTAQTPSRYLLGTRVLRTLEVQRGDSTSNFAYLRDDAFDYLGTPDGLYRSADLFDSAAGLDRLPGIDDDVQALALRGSVLYVAKEGNETPGISTDHSFLRSSDRGLTFTPLDGALEECGFGYCRFLTPTEIDFGAGGELFLNAGGNIVVSHDEGASWRILYGVPEGGKPASQVCPVVMRRLGTTFLYGGECPLDHGYIRRGVLAADGKSWSVMPETVPVPKMENRNVQFISAAGNAVYAGIEGALLRSVDDGRTFEYVVRYELDAEEKYPYINQFFVDPGNPSWMLIGGFDKKHDANYLASSIDGGRTWTDVSDLVGGKGGVVLILSTRDGRVVVGTRDERQLTLRQLLSRGGPARRRPL